MSRLYALTVAAALFVSTSAMAASPPQVPALSGVYIISSNAHCLNPDSTTLTSGTWTFKRGLRTFDSVEFESAGDIDLVKEIGTKNPYTIKAHHFQIGGTPPYTAQYGEIENGIAKYVSLIRFFKMQGHALTCVQQATLVHK